MRYYNRPNSAKNFYTLERVFKSPHANQLKTITSTAPATTASLPATGTEYVSADGYAENVICGGSVKKIGGLICIQSCDQKAGESVEFYYSGIFNMQLTAAITPVAGNAAYVVDATGLVHDTAAAGRTKVGVFKEATTYTAASLDLDGAGAVSFAIVELNQIP